MINRHTDTRGLRYKVVSILDYHIGGASIGDMDDLVDDLIGELSAYNEQVATVLKDKRAMEEEYKKEIRLRDNIIEELKNMTDNLKEKVNEYNRGIKKDKTVKMLEKKLAKTQKNVRVLKSVVKEQWNILERSMSYEDRAD